MTKKELIEALKDYPDDSKVNIWAFKRHLYGSFPIRKIFYSDKLNKIQIEPKETGGE